MKTYLVTISNKGITELMSVKAFSTGQVKRFLNDKKILYIRTIAY